MARLASLTADASAPTKLSSKQTTKLRQHSRVVKLSQRNKALTSKIHNVGYKTINDAEGTTLYQEKKKIEAQLSCLKVKLRNHFIVQSHKRHFRKTDTQAFDAQFSVIKVPPTIELDIHSTTSIEYNILERAKVVRLTCGPANDLSDREKLRRRL